MDENGLHIVLTLTTDRKRLVAQATINIYYRRIIYKEIAKLEEIQACRCTLNVAFKKEQYHRRVATEKPLLTEAHKRARLAWALAHRDWPLWMWARALWTNKASFSTGGFRKVYVT